MQSAKFRYLLLSSTLHNAVHIMQNTMYYTLRLSHGIFISRLPYFIEGNIKISPRIQYIYDLQLDPEVRNSCWCAKNKEYKNSRENLNKIRIPIREHALIRRNFL